MQKMSEKEAIMYLKSIKDAMCDSLTQQQAKKAIDMAIKALEEILLYKQGGLVFIPADVYQRQCDELDAYKTIADEDVNVETRQILTDLAFDEEKIKDFKEVKALQKAVIALKEIQQYREIGTVDQCREAVERMKPKKPIREDSGCYDYDFDYKCPTCGEYIDDTADTTCCGKCGQHIDWSE